MITSKNFLWIIILGAIMPLLTKTYRPQPHLQSATISWWPSGPLHSSLVYFSEGQQNRYQLDQAFEYFKNNATISQQFPLSLVDIVTQYKIFPNKFVLNSTSANPGGTYTNFTRLIKSNKPSKKRPWYLVLKIDRAIKELRNTILNTWFTTFKTFSMPYLPHITLGKIIDIKDPEIFLESIQKTNEQILNQPNTSILFDKNHMVLKHPKQDFKGTKYQSSLLMLNVGKNEPAEKLALSIISSWPQKEQEVILSQQQPLSFFEKISQKVANWLCQFKLYILYLFGIV